jgi:hypothetical protein
LPRSNKFPHCQRRTLPSRLKAVLIRRQDGCCADCTIRLVDRSYVFDHRPALALRDVHADANDPNLLAVICQDCNKAKTARDLKEIARFRRRGFTFYQPRNPVRTASMRQGTQPPEILAPQPRRPAAAPASRVIREAQDLWEHEKGHWHHASPSPNVVEPTASSMGCIGGAQGRPPVQSLPALVPRVVSYVPCLARPRA